MGHSRSTTTSGKTSYPSGSAMPDRYKTSDSFKPIGHFYPAFCRSGRRAWGLISERWYRLIELVAIVPIQTVANNGEALLLRDIQHRRRRAARRCLELLNGLH